MRQWKPGQPLQLETERFLMKSLNRLEVVWYTYGWTFDTQVMHPFGLEAGTWTRRSWYRRFRKPNNRRKFCLGIWPKGGDKPIGLEIVEISAHKVATLSVIIGDRSWWGKGVVQETRSAIVDFLFDKLECPRVWGTPSSRNFPSIFNYQKLGFTCEGILRQHGFDPATKQRCDFIIYSMLRNEWLEKQKDKATA